MVVLKAEADGQVKWDIGEADADKFEFQNNLIFVATKAGRYRVIAWTAAGNVPSDAAVCFVVIEGSEPVDQLLVEVRRAYQADGSSEADIRQLASDMRQLAAVFRNAKAFIPQKKLLGEVHQALQQAIGAVITRGKYPNLSRVVSSHLRSSLPSDGNLPLTPELKNKIESTLGELEQALEKVTR